MKRKNTVLLALVGMVLLTLAVVFLVRLGSDKDTVDEGALSNPIEVPASSDPSILASMDEIETQVSQLRGLTMDTKVPRQLLTRDELRQVVLDDFLEGYEAEDGERDVAVMNVFGLLPGDFELYNFYVELYTEQIAGYYDSKEAEMFVISDSGFGGMERTTYAHEFVHTLQDDHFDFEGNLGFTDELCQQDSERCAAIQSLIEGDATLTGQLWFQQYGTQQDLEELTDFATSYESPVFDSAPLALSESMTFPYTYGGTFVQSLYSQGGFEAVDNAFTIAPPVSTEQIMHPALYPDELPNNPALPDLDVILGQGWTQIESGNLGEFYIYLVMAKGYDSKFRLFDTLALDAADGWGGDTYSVLRNDQSGELAAMVVFNWDTSADSEAALAAFRSYNDLRFGTFTGDAWEGNGYFSNLVETDEDSFIWVISQNLETLQTLQVAAQ